MSSRITNLQLNNSFINDIFKQRQDLLIAQQQVSSGLKVRNPSDDAGRAGTIAEFQYTLLRVERHEQRISLTETLLSIQESVLSEAETILVRAQELATQGINETNSSDVRATIAQEVWALRDALVSLANTKAQGIFIYGGARDDVPPFTSQTGAPGPALPPPLNSTGGYAIPPTTEDSDANKRTVFNNLAGTEVTRSVSVSDNDTMRINSRGNQIFQRAITAVETLGRALAGYDTELAADPITGNLVPITGAGGEFNTYSDQTERLREVLDILDDARTRDIGLEISNVGARLNSLKDAKSILSTIKINVQESRSTLQDVDIFEAASRLASLQTNLQALLTSGTILQQQSLLDYI